MGKPILVLDFDGVLHSYKSGWKGATVIPDPPTPGAQEFCMKAQEYFELYIVSSRCSQEDGIHAILQWLEENQFLHNIMVTAKKPPAFLTIDDRAFQFMGFWPNVEWLHNFRPYHQLPSDAHEKQVERAWQMSADISHDLVERATKEADRLRAALQGIWKMADDMLRYDGEVDYTHQIEADARAALGIELEE